MSHSFVKAVPILACLALVLTLIVSTALTVTASKDYKARAHSFFSVQVGRTALPIDLLMVCNNRRQTCAT